MKFLFRILTLRPLPLQTVVPLVPLEQRQRGALEEREGGVDGAVEEGPGEEVRPEGEGLGADDVGVVRLAQAGHLDVTAAPPPGVLVRRQVAVLYVERRGVVVHQDLRQERLGPLGERTEGHARRAVQGVVGGDGHQGEVARLLDEGQVGGGLGLRRPDVDLGKGGC